MSIKIHRLELENVKRIKAVVLEPTPEGLTVIGGRNRQGKSSVLDAIAWALGGNKFRPSEPRRDGSVVPPSLRIELSNGLIVERKGKNSDLKVLDPSGNKAGQSLVDEFVGQLALNLPKFLQASSKDKAQTLLQIIGVGDKLYELEQKEQQLYARRHEIGRIADQKEKHAAELIEYPEASAEPVSAAALIHQQQEILARNGEHQRLRDRAGQLQQTEQQLRERITYLEQQLQEVRRQHTEVLQDWELAQKSAAELQDESTTELEESIEQIDLVNQKVRANLEKERATQEAADYKAQYLDLTEQLQQVRQKKTDLLEGADLPLPGLSVSEGELTYQGYRWDNLSGSDQLRVATAIVRRLHPQCGFVLLDKLEQMDLQTLQEFGSWLQAEGLQAIATRVSTGGECSILIEDGYSSTPETPAMAGVSGIWKAGEF